MKPAQYTKNCDADRIKKISDYLQKSLNAIARDLGMKNAQTFYDIKNGRHGISKKLASKIHERYNEINEDWVLTGNGPFMDLEGKRLSFIKTLVMPQISNTAGLITDLTEYYSVRVDTEPNANTVRALGIEFGRLNAKYMDLLDALYNDLLAIDKMFYDYAATEHEETLQRIKEIEEELSVKRKGSGLIEEIDEDLRTEEPKGAN